MSTPSEEKQTALRYVRNLAELSQATVSEDLKIDQTTLRDWERQTRLPATPTRVVRVLEYYATAIEGRLSRKFNDRVVADVDPRLLIRALANTYEAIDSLRQLELESTGWLSAEAKKTRIAGILEMILPQRSSKSTPEPPLIAEPTHGSRVWR